MTTAPDFSALVAAMRSDLAEIARQDFGYPLGTNEVRPPEGALPSALPSALHELYGACDGLSMPDVHVGYFVDRAARAAAAAQRGEPTELAKSPVHVFGSDGGGGRFALGTHDGAVYYLPSSGAVRGVEFIADASAPVQKLAPDVGAFLARLAADVHAFAEDDRAHVYLVS